jgi:hypothetical protein
MLALSLANFHGLGEMEDAGVLLCEACCMTWCVSMTHTIDGRTEAFDLFSDGQFIFGQLGLILNGKRPSTWLKPSSLPPRNGFQSLNAQKIL